MKTMTAIIKVNGNITSKKGDYQTKREFKAELEGNGVCNILAILTEKQVNELKVQDIDFSNEYHEYVKEIL